MILCFDSQSITLEVRCNLIVWHLDIIIISAAIRVVDVGKSLSNIVLTIEIHFCTISFIKEIFLVLF